MSSILTARKFYLGLMVAKVIDSKQDLSKTIQIQVGSVFLSGNLVLPEHTRALVIFSHGSGSSRFSPRNNFVAQQLNKKGIGSFLVDLLTAEEDLVYKTRFDIDLLTDRLIGITKWLSRDKTTNGLRFGYFGASTGAASALQAAALLPQLIRAVVSRGGRPDLSLSRLHEVNAPTLLIVGEFDFDVMKLNQDAFEKLRCEKQLSEVAKATHLFEEPGALEEVASLATAWFERHLLAKSAKLK